MGPHYDNETSQYQYSEEVLNAHWITVFDTNTLYLLPKDGDSFDTYSSGDDEKEEYLNTLTDAQLTDSDFMEEQGYMIVPHFQRRFSINIGYYFV